MRFFNDIFINDISLKISFRKKSNYLKGWFLNFFSLKGKPFLKFLNLLYLLQLLQILLYYIYYSTTFTTLLHLLPYYKWNTYFGSCFPTERSEGGKNDPKYILLLHWTKIAKMFLIFLLVLLVMMNWNLKFGQDIQYI